MRRSLIILSQNLEPLHNDDKENQTNTNWTAFFKIPLKVMKTTERLRNHHRLEKTKETWQICTVLHPGLDCGGAKWPELENNNLNKFLKFYIIVMCQCWFLGFDKCHMIKWDISQRGNWGEIHRTCLFRIIGITWIITIHEGILQSEPGGKLTIVSFLKIDLYPWNL